jgi:outer membrane receptor for ferrienterochelin and colicins
MRLLSILIVFFTSVTPLLAQETFKAIIRNAEHAEPIMGATVNFPALNKTAISDANGQVLINGITEGIHVFEIRHLNYRTKTDTLSFPLRQDANLVFLLQEAEHSELEEVFITSTRSSRTIDDIPTRVEVIAGEELDEKANMKPGDIRMVLNESTGIQTQQTSATSANAAIRIQGLDGRYTQILKDGLPIFSGAASGLGLLQTPPLDLKQVEVIKGSASTLYGGGAIAGLVNLVSKIPGDERELSFHLNGTSAGGLDLNGFYSEKFENLGLTLFASRNTNKPFDPSNSGFTAIPKFERYVFNPKVFVDLSERTSFMVGLNTAFENRIGGDVLQVRGEGDLIHRYFERNVSDRISSQSSFQHQFNSQSQLNLRNSVSYFRRKISIPDYAFDGTQTASFSELNYANVSNKLEWVAGLNAVTDHFKENKQTSVALRDYDRTTVGAFVQSTIKANNWLEMEAGLRTDYVVNYRPVVLPRVSFLFRFSDQLTSRVGGGLGYAVPTIFTEESERLQYQGVTLGNNKLERSSGLNADVNYRTSLFDDRVALTVNQLLFYTYLNNPLELQALGADQRQVSNLPGHIDTKGGETNLKMSYSDFKLFVGYTFTDTRYHEGAIQTRYPLTAKHRLNNVLMYEVEEKWKLGLEAYYYSRQRLSNGSSGRPFWITGFMAEKLWERLSLYINFENFTDTRQTRFENINAGTVSNPLFRDIYAPLDGFVVNGGLKIRL